ncbi:MAG: nucleotide-binding protein [Bacteroidales bacterium]|jgi:predicted nucleotide-binding protein|nr:nucleotide-binding protein [Bacteroidales bacterium]
MGNTIQDIHDIEHLKTRYQQCNEGERCNTNLAINAYLEWYSAASVLFSQYFTDEDFDLRRFKSVDNSGNGYTLRSNYNSVIANYTVLIDKIKNINTDSGDMNKVSGEKKIFIAHGHDDEMKEKVARVIEKLGFKAIILHEKAGEGNTIIEKLEKNSDVSFAIVLLSQDDEINNKSETVEFRARQNVIFEMGYFIGKLGRRNVCIIKQDNVKILSNIDGINYILYNNGWEQKVIKEMKSAGLEVDSNKLYE